MKKRETEWHGWRITIWWENGWQYVASRERQLRSGTVERNDTMLVISQLMQKEGSDAKK